jgi:hypothetical protein
MSRTFRRKNIEQEQNDSWKRAGRKQAGAYTESDTISCVNILGYYRGFEVYRKPTDAEYAKQYRRNHSDSSHWYNKPNKWYRFFTIHIYRMADKREIRKYMQNEDYEPMCRIRVSSGYWD